MLLDHRSALYGFYHGHHWGEEMVMQANMYDLLIHNTLVTAKAAGAKNYKAPPPYPLPEALRKKRDADKGITKNKQHVFSYEEGVAWFDSQFATATAHRVEGILPSGHVHPGGHVRRTGQGMPTGTFKARASMTSSATISVCTAPFLSHHEYSATR